MVPGTAKRQLGRFQELQRISDKELAQHLGHEARGAPLKAIAHHLFGKALQTKPCERAEKLLNTLVNGGEMVSKDRICLLLNYKH